MSFLLQVILILLLFASPALATDYYFCACETGANGSCVEGNDSPNTGTSPSSPWKTYAKAHSLMDASAPEAAAGDTINFGRGCAWNQPTPDDNKWRNTNATAANPITIQEYIPSWATGGTALPIIRWEFVFSNDGDAVHHEGLVIKNLRMIGTGNSGVALFFYNDQDDVTITNVEASGYDTGISLSGCNAATAHSCYSDDFVIDSVNMHDNGSFGFLGGGYNVIIQNSTFENNGFLGATVFKHNLYISGTEAEFSNIQILNNTLYHNLNNVGVCSSVPLVVHGLIVDLVIKGNHVYEDVGTANTGCWGIAVDHGHAETEYFLNAVIDSNRIENVGGMGIGISDCVNCVIKNNAIRFDAAVPSETCIVLNDKSEPEDTVSTNGDILNNTCKMVGTSSGGYVGIDAEDPDFGGTSWRVVNNILKFSGTGTFECLDTNVSTSPFEMIDYNLCNFTSGSWSNGNTLAAWQAATPWDDHSLTSDPLFTSSTNLSLQSGSPAIEAGTNVGVTVDITGATRVGTPDIGAYEFLGALPQAPSLLGVGCRGCKF